MKKNIEFIRADEPLLRWAARTLEDRPGEKPEGAGELIDGFTGLLADSEAVLMIGRENTPELPLRQQKICCGELTIYLSSRRVTRAGREIVLTPKEFDILAFLARNPGEVFTKEQIYRGVWDEAYLLDDSNIMAFIRKIRKKIEPNPDAPQYIRTIWGIGYKFCDIPPVTPDPAEYRTV